MYEILVSLNHTGIAVLTHCPTEKDDDVLSIANRIASPMNTIYGYTWRVEATPKPINVAYSSIELELHQDLVYYESPPGLQLLSCRQFDEDVTGGESLFLDSFTAAYLLKQRKPKHFHDLSTIPASFQKIHYNRESPVHLVYNRPHIQLSQGTVPLVIYQHQHPSRPDQP